MPLDREAILESVKKTGRLVIVDEAQAFCGFSAEIAAMAGEQALEYLNAPIKRVCALHTPHPFNPVLESAMLPAVPQIVEAVRQVIRG
jgi:pyruvate dehydrogenase E1 component beta subunit